MIRKGARGGRQQHTARRARTGAKTTEELRAIVDAVLAGDADAAARACSRHVEEAGRVGLAALIQQDGT
jgi:DNA-binding GntR family transcriptional regulator